MQMKLIGKQVQTSPEYPVVVLYPTDPRVHKLGGIETAITTLLSKKSPFSTVRFVGVDAFGDLPAGRWNEITYDGKKLDFFPLFRVRDLNRRTLPPLNLRFTYALWKHKTKILTQPAALDIHRVDHMLPFWNDFRFPIILTIHGTSKNIHLPNESWVAKIRPLFLLLERISILRANKIFCVSEEGVEYYRRLLGTGGDKVSLIENGVDFDLFAPQNPVRCRNLFNLPLDKKILLFVGRLEKVKDPDLLLQTFREVRSARPDVVLVLAGDGRAKEKLMARHSDLQNDLIFLGALPHARLPELFSAADCLLLTSHFEGMPRAVLESLAAGLPVVSTNVGDVSKVVINGFSGFVVSNRSPRTLAEKTLEILKFRPSFEVCRQALDGYEAKAVLEKIDRANQAVAQTFYGYSR
ncbi:MAG TPA: glycosyltransferase family 4 protein [Verrucomicrobiae bacterium]|nr:glycosyltransferase family 4 protein [Verrucomicrobiae bacterium]